MNTNLVILPTRGRPEKARECLLALKEHSVISDFVIGIDDDDATDYMRYPVEGVTYEINPRLRMNGTLNLLVNKYADKYESIYFLGDDHLVRTPGWDEKLYAPIKEKGYGVSYGNDLFQGENLPTAVMQSSNLVQHLGYFSPPKLIHLYMDNYWKLLGQTIGALFYHDDVVIEHMHYLAGKSEEDAGYQEVNSGPTYTHDRQVFMDYFEKEYPEILKGLIEKFVV